MDIRELQPQLCCSINTYAVCEACKFRLCFECVDKTKEQEWIEVESRKYLICPKCGEYGAWRTEFEDAQTLHWVRSP